MKKLALALSLFIAIFAVSLPASATSSSFDNKASGFCAYFPTFCAKVKAIFKKKHSYKHKKKSYGHKHVKSVPEIDAAGASIALALLAGILGIRREYRARKQSV